MEEILIATNLFDPFCGVLLWYDCRVLDGLEKTCDTMCSG